VSHFVLYHIVKRVMVHATDSKAILFDFLYCNPITCSRWSTHHGAL